MHKTTNLIIIILCVSLFSKVALADGITKRLDESNTLCYAIITF